MFASEFGWSIEHVLFRLTVLRNGACKAIRVKFDYSNEP